MPNAPSTAPEASSVARAYWQSKGRAQGLESHHTEQTYVRRCFSDSR